MFEIEANSDTKDLDRLIKLKDPLKAKLKVKLVKAEYSVGEFAAKDIKLVNYIDRVLTTVIEKTVN